MKKADAALGMKGIAAGIVMYEPEEERFLECLRSIEKQADTIYIFDNSEKTAALRFSDKVVYMTENCNKGIAYALNRIMESAKKDGFQWVATLDQDSVVPDGLFAEYAAHIADDIAIVCPQVIDKRRPYMVPKEEPSEEFVHKCITSASCTSVKAWEEVGKFDEWMFVDLVDNDFCRRLLACGYRILRLNHWILDQEFGKIELKSERSQKFWLGMSRLLHNMNFGKLCYKKYVNPVRVYYTNRNIIYLNRKLKNYRPVGYESYYCNSYIGFLFCFSAPSILRAQDKRKTIAAVCRGIRDGRKKEVEIWSCPMKADERKSVSK